MAQFTPQGRLKLLFHGDGVEPKDPLHYKLVSNVFGGSGGLESLQVHKNRLRFLNSSTTRRYFSSSSLKKGWEFNAKACLNVRDEGIYGEEDYDSEVEVDELACFRGLVLDISYRPVNVVCWRRSICLEFMDKADVLEYYDQTVNSPSGSFYIPAVLRVPHLLQVVKRRRIRTNLSRKNVLFRDNFTCQYCSAHENLTIDHVLPVARGGKWVWENLTKQKGPKECKEYNRRGRKVTACAKCNSKKGQKTPEEANMKLNKVPKAPKDFDILAIPLTSAAIRMLRKRNGTPEEWRQYLSPSTEP